MPENFWDIISKLLYLCSISRPENTAYIKDAMGALHGQLELKLGKGQLYAVHRHEPVGGRDFPEAVILGVFTSRHFAVEYLIGLLIERVKHSSGGITPEDIAALRAGQDFWTLDPDDRECSRYTVMPVMNGLDPKP